MKRLHLTTTILTLLAGLVATSPAWAQTAEAATAPVALPKFTVSSQKDQSYTADDTLGVSRIRTSLLETPQSVVVLNRNLIDDIGGQRTFDAVKYVSGISAGNVNYAQDRVTLRGLVATDNYVDGTVMLWGETNADQALIERVEVIKGPAPILFANGPAAGLINKVTKSPQAEEHRTVKVTVGTFDADRAEVDLTGPVTADKKLLYRVIAARQDSDGYYDNTYMKRWVVAPSLTYRFTEASEVTLKYDYTDSNFGSYNGIPLDRLTGKVIDVPPETNYADPSNFRKDEMNRLALTGTTQITDWLGARLALTAVWVNVAREESRVGGKAATGVTGQNSEFYGTLPVIGDRTSLLRNSQYFGRDSLGLTLQNDYVARYHTGPVEQTTLAGLELRRGSWDRVGSALVYDTINPFGPLPASIPPRGAINASFDESQRDQKFYALQEMGFFSRRILLSGGVTRNFDRYRSTNTLTATTALTPTFRKAQDTTLQGGVVVKITDGLSAFVGYNESFQPNNNLNTDGNQLPNLTGKQTEIGLKGSLWQNRVRFTAAWFDIKASSTQAAPPGRPINTVIFVNQKSRGFDADVTLAVTSNFDAIVTFANYDVKDSTTVYVPNVSETTASTWLRYTWKDSVLSGLSFGVGANYQSSRHGTAGPNIDGSGNAFDSALNNYANTTFTLPGRTLADLMVSYALNSSWKFALNVDNVFDKRYIDAVRYANTLQPGYGRNVKFSTTYSF